MKPLSVVMHPAPTQNIVVAWRSPVAAAMRIEAKVQHAHPECGNGVTWSLELKRGGAKRRLASGIAHGPTEVPVGPIENVAVRPGDVVALSLGPRDGNHSCDTTGVWLTLKGGDKTWDLAADVAPNIHAGNPHADSFGNADVWRFFIEPAGSDAGVAFPPGSALARWQSAASPAAKNDAALAVAKLLQSRGAAAKGPDAVLYRQLAALGGPLVGAERNAGGVPIPANGGEFGIDPASFGKHPGGRPIDSASLCIKAPAAIELKLPADLGEGYELVTGGALDRNSGGEGSVQLELTAAKPTLGAGARTSAATNEAPVGSWSAGAPGVRHAAPILVREGSAARKRIEAAFDAFRDVFPPALCYAKIVPVDEVVTLTLHYREDDALKRLMLSESEAGELDRLWNELHFVSRDALQLVDAYKQLMEYATQDADPSAFEPLRKPIMARAEAFRRELAAAEPVQLRQAIAFAARAYRRPLATAESRGLESLYARLRKQELPHEEAIRMTLARVLVAPEFLFRPERPADGGAQSPVSDWELASRLSYFL
ncbi:MAG TPA: DUF1595 domain-containing protein, partial [Planctomycetia bacterium]|nr:DUF1595 domain-containing protein [Planctomycetia bacterium]